VIAGLIQWLWSLSRLWTAACRRHSERTADLPRRWNRRKPRLNLFWAKTGSDCGFAVLVELVSSLSAEHSAHERVRAFIPSRSGVLA
jgi:hypothetical protein